MSRYSHRICFELLLPAAVDAAAVDEVDVQQVWLKHDELLAPNCLLVVCRLLFYLNNNNNIIELLLFLLLTCFGVESSN